MDIVTIVKYINFCLAFFGLAVWIFWAIRHKEKWGYSLLPALFFVHSIVFGTFSNLNMLTSFDYIVWKNLLITHGLIVLISGAILMIFVIDDENNRNETLKSAFIEECQKWTQQ